MAEEQPNFGNAALESQTFYLDGLSYGITAAQGTILGNDTTIINADATCEMEIELSIVQHMFQFQSDALDVNDVSASDLRYRFQDPTEGTLEPTAYDIDDVHNPGNAYMLVDPVRPVVPSGDLGLPGKNVANLNNQAKHDWPRWLALKLFGTYSALDIINNEADVRDSILTGAATALADRFTAITAYQETYGIPLPISEAEGAPERKALAANKLSAAIPLVDGEAAVGEPEMGPSKLIMDQIISSTPERLQESIQNTPYFQPVPLRVGDTIAFKMTVAPHADQLTTLAYTPGESLADIVPDHSYLVKMVIVDDV